jgi:hypothetical protein
MFMTIVKWISLPLLLTGSVFARFAGVYEVVLHLLVCAGALVVVQRAVAFREYFWAAASVGVAVIFSPLTLLVKIFLLMVLLGLASLAGVYAARKPQPVETL